jgi:hypothetical protein
MPIAASKRPDKEWLTLFEAVTYRALGEALDTEALAQVEYPSDRAYGAEIKKAAERSRAEARLDPRFAEFLRLLGDDDRGKVTMVPRPADLRKCELSSSGEQLLDLIERLELAQAEEEQKEAEAQQLLRRALDSRKVSLMESGTAAVRTSTCSSVTVPPRLIFTPTSSRLLPIGLAPITTEC